MEYKRIQFIDIAKGITILIIALTHTYGNSGGFAIEVFSIFKVPTFFLLSGLFFKTYDSYKVFAKKKINQLVVPLIFAFLIFSLPWTLFMEWYFDDSTFLRDVFLVHGTNKLNFGLAPGAWFVLCLLIIQILYYIVHVISRENSGIISVVVISAGLLGYIINVYDISLPFWIDTAITSLPFFTLGVFLGRHGDIMRPNMTLKQWKLFLISFLILLLSIYKLGDGIIFYAINRYNVSILLLFGGGVAGAFAILLLSKMIGEFSPLSFVGRYSLIVLLTHQMYLFLLRNLAYQMQLPQDSNLLSALLFVVVILLEIPTIFFCKKYMSWAFGLRELVK